MPQFLKDGEVIIPKRKGTFYTDVIAVIPAYNAEKTIGNVVRKTLRKVGRCIVVDDGSSDGTGNAAIDAGAELIVHVSNRGKGVAICTAINALRKISYKYIVFLDADGQHQPGEIARIVQAAQRRRAHLVCGNRMSKPEGMPFIRRATNRVMSKVVSKLCKVNLTDTQCGYRLLSKKAVESLQLTKSNFEVDSEMLYQVAHKRLKVTEVTVSSIYSSGDYSSHIRPVKDTCCFLRTAFGLFFSNLKPNTAENTKVISKEKPKPKTEKPRAKVVRLKAKVERPRPKVERPKVKRPKVERPKVERPKVERPKVEKPKVEKPKAKDERPTQ